MDMIVVLELGHRQEIIPVILSLIDEDAKILLQLLIDSFGLPIRLRMIGRRGCDSDRQQAVQLSSELPNELDTSVRNHVSRQTMQLPHMVQEESRCSSRRDGGVRGDEVRSLRNRIHHIHDCIVAMGFG
jgi:hypothetical protein